MSKQITIDCPLCGREFTDTVKGGTVQRPWSGCYTVIPVDEDAEQKADANTNTQEKK